MLFKQLITSDKSEHFSFKDGHGVYILRCLKRAGLAIAKWFRFVSKVNSYATMELKNKTVCKAKSILCVATSPCDM